MNAELIETIAVTVVSMAAVLGTGTLLVWKQVARVESEPVVEPEAGAVRDLARLTR